jgi:hypothetical protein
MAVIRGWLCCLRVLNASRRGGVGLSEGRSLNFDIIMRHQNSILILLTDLILRPTALYIPDPVTCGWLGD